MKRPVTTWKVIAGGALVAAGATALACGSDDAGGSASGGTGGVGGTSGSGGASGAGGSGGAAGSGGSGGVVDSECPPGLASDPDVGQSLPQASVDTAWVAPTGASTQVASGGDLQAALDAAQPGDEIRLESGATFSGPFTLPKKSGDGVIVIRTDVADSELPAPGQRIDPSYSGKLAKIVVSGNVGAAIQAAAGAHHYRLVGLEISPAPGEYVGNLVNLGTGATSTADLAHHIVIDRCYLHGDATAGARRGVALNSADTAVVGSWLSDFKEKAADSQAIAGWTGPGPFKIVNNHLEGAAENVMFGGADPAIQDLVPSDITICRNHIVKPAAWQALDWSEKNLFELKNARRVLVAGNVLENNWADAQVGFAVVLTPRNQDGSAPWSTVEDLTFVYNVIRHTASGITIAGEDDNHPSRQQQRVLIQNNLLDDIDDVTYGGDGRVFQIVAPQKPSKQVKIDHNTATQAGNAFLVLGDSVVVSDGVTITNNIVPKGDYGGYGTGKGEGTGAFDFFFSNYVFDKNAIVGGSASDYPAGNFFPASMGDVGFADFAGGNFVLTSSSAYAGKGTDGKDLGADVNAVLDAISGVSP